MLAPSFKPYLAHSFLQCHIVLASHPEPGKQRKSPLYCDSQDRPKKYSQLIKAAFWALRFHKQLDEQSCCVPQDVGSTCPRTRAGKAARKGRSPNSWKEGSVLFLQWINHIMLLLMGILLVDLALLLPAELNPAQKRNKLHGCKGAAPLGSVKNKEKDEPTVNPSAETHRGVSP